MAFTKRTWLLLALPLIFCVSSVRAQGYYEFLGAPQVVPDRHSPNPSAARPNSPVTGLRTGRYTPNSPPTPIAEARPESSKPDAYGSQSPGWPSDATGRAGWGGVLSIHWAVAAWASASANTMASNERCTRARK